ncbi:sigma factor [Microvirga arsenatis]|uniref:RNA polymerase sigma-70 region 2 domain-containing protein n=1 Tax=Microvirga arsenatis TaxID=2692265 RepID=A0ABW9YYG1_9HYPH|nr:hypothetical protein [Microvirga arsenatis]NBJ25434.1 hypothetical protein [Microvirga arsenatis]
MAGCSEVSTSRDQEFPPSTWLGRWLFSGSYAVIRLVLKVARRLLGRPADVADLIQEFTADLLRRINEAVILMGSSRDRLCLQHVELHAASL